MPRQVPRRRSTHAALLALVLLGFAAAAAPEVDEALRAELLERMERDQQVRKLDIQSISNEERMKAIGEFMKVDRENTTWLKALVHRIGWPTPALVGEDGAHAAWLLVQHADMDPAFQAECLPLLRAAAERGEGSLTEVAYLTDRVRVKQGLPQLYGTQYDVVTDRFGNAITDADGNMQYVAPLVEDVARLDERRAAVGLPPWREYEKIMAELQSRATLEPRTVEPPPPPPGPWPFAVARAPLETMESRGYLASVMDLLDREDEALASDELRVLFLDVLATRLAFVGEETRATLRGDEAYGRDRPSPGDGAVADLLETHRPAPALETIVEIARGRQIVMVNEEHRSSMQRAFTNRLLAPFREAGFTHLAVETLVEDPARLRERGYPVIGTGAYTVDPVFGDLIRRALDLGYVIVGYEADPEASQPRPEDASPADAMNRRERGQAENIHERILKTSPDARVLVVAGRDHIAESSGVWTPMGGILAELSGVDPFTVNQMTMVEHSAPRFEHWAFRAVDGAGWLEGEPVVLRDDEQTLWSADPDALDVYLFHPRTRYERGRPHWMRMGGLRRPVRAVFPAADVPVLLQATAAGETTDAIPVDQAIWWPDEPDPALFLRPGRYTLRMLDREGTERHRRQVTID